MGLIPFGEGGDGEMGCVWSRGGIGRRVGCSVEKWGECKGILYMRLHIQMFRRGDCFRTTDDVGPNGFSTV